MGEVKLTKDFRCPECGCRSFAPVDERQPDGTFAPGNLARCVHCKSVSKAPAIRSAVEDDEKIHRMRDSWFECEFDDGEYTIRWEDGKFITAFESGTVAVGDISCVAKTTVSEFLEYVKRIALSHTPDKGEE